MSGYVQKALRRVQHPPPIKPQNQPHEHTVPNYGATQQYTNTPTKEPTLDTANKIFIQQVLGAFLYYARAIDHTMLVALSAIAAEQATPTNSIVNKIKTFLDYAATQEQAVITYRISDMVLAIHSDASYLSERNA
mmetsp:Transcript_35759/g.55005  ORF Transcript_35759/g.55005 Transcript_35759/m.55005 type:complete len:135 (-) Transcript_35759:380-784(-)